VIVGFFLEDVEEVVGCRGELEAKEAEVEVLKRRLRGTGLRWQRVTFVE
jgi:hypothetical protein